VLPKTASYRKRLSNCKGSWPSVFMSFRTFVKCSWFAFHRVPISEVDENELIAQMSNQKRRVGLLWARQSGNANIFRRENQNMRAPESPMSGAAGRRKYKLTERIIFTLRTSTSKEIQAQSATFAWRRLAYVYVCRSNFFKRKNFPTMVTVSKNFWKKPTYLVLIVEKNPPFGFCVWCLLTFAVALHKTRREPPLSSGYKMSDIIPSLNTLFAYYRKAQIRLQMPRRMLTLFSTKLARLLWLLRVSYSYQLGKENWIAEL